MSDILWQNTSGQAAIWEMNGTSIDRRRDRGRPIPGRAGRRSEPATSTATAIPTSCGRTRARPGRDLGDERDQRDRRRDGRAPIPGRAGTRSEPATSTATAIPTSCGRTRDGQAAIWEMNGTSIIGGGTVERQSRAELARHRDRRLQRRRPFRHPVAEHERPGRDLGHERDQPSPAAGSSAQSRAELARRRAVMTSLARGRPGWSGPDRPRGQPGNIELDRKERSSAARGSE